MTYLQAKKEAEQAKAFAESAAQFTTDDGVRELALAVGYLSAAVAELASTKHRES